MPWYHCPDNWSADIPIYRIAEGTNLQQLGCLDGCRNIRAYETEKYIDLTPSLIPSIRALIIP